MAKSEVNIHDVRLFYVTTSGLVILCNMVKNRKCISIAWNYSMQQAKPGMCVCVCDLSLCLQTRWLTCAVRADVCTSFDRQLFHPIPVQSRSKRDLMCVDTLTSVCRRHHVTIRWLTSRSMYSAVKDFFVCNSTNQNLTFFITFLTDTHLPPISIVFFVHSPY